MAHLKGQNVNLLLNLGDSSSTMAVVAASTSCDFSISANTADAAAKDDPGNGDWDNAEFQNYSWSCSNESFLVDITYLQALLDKVVNGNCEVAVQFQTPNTLYGNSFGKKGKAVITSLDIDCPNGDNVKISLSMEGNGNLENLDSYADITPASEFKTRIKGKALMIAVNTATTGAAVWKTIACSTSHKLSISAQTADVTDKDMNEKIVVKEVTGRSLTLSTENLIEVCGQNGPSGKGFNDMYGYITGGTVLELCLGYYPNSIGQSVHEGNTGSGWTGMDSVMLQGKFTCTSLSMSGANKDNVTWSAEFAGKGKPTVTAPSTESAQAEE